MKKVMVFLVIFAFLFQIENMNAGKGKTKIKDLSNTDKLFLICKKRVTLVDGIEKKLKNDSEIRKAILDLNVDINVKTKKKGNTPLHIAVNHKRGKVVRVLVGLGARIDEQNKAGKSPLDKVKQQLKNYEAMKALFDAKKNFTEYFSKYDDSDEE